MTSNVFATRALVALLFAPAFALGCSPRGAPEVAFPRAPVAAASQLSGSPTHAVQADSETYLFGDDGVSVFSGQRRAHAFPFRGGFVSATLARSPDGLSRYILALTTKGALVRVVPGIGIDGTVSVSYGVPDGPIRAIAPVDDGLALAHTQGLYVVRRGTLSRYPFVLHALAGAGQWVFGVEKGDRVLRLDLATHSVRRWVLPGVTSTAVAADGQLYAVAGRRLWRAYEGMLVPSASPLPDHGTLVATALGVLVVSPRGIYRLAPTGELAAVAESGTAYLGDSGAGLVVLTRGGVESVRTGEAGAPLWASEVRGIYQRRCATCHGPTDSVPLDSEPRWRARSSRVMARVVEERTMPPEGPLPENERETVRAWLKAASGGIKEAE